MSHFSTLVFINTEYQDIESTMERYLFESEDYQEFEVQIKAKDIEKKKEEILSDKAFWRERLKEYLKAVKQTPVEFLCEYHGYIEDEGTHDLGYMTNFDGRCDFYDLSGRWKNTLISKSGEFVNDAPISDIDFEATENNMKKEFIKGGNLKTDFKGLAFWIWNIVDEDDGWIDNPDDQTIKEYIEKHKDNKNIQVYIVDCHS